jgi:SAM-dependent methyltransferase
VFEHYTPAHSGLDFGSGPGPVATVMLREAGYNIRPFDPFYEPDPDALRHPYDYIICCEVAEHFHHPADEFSRLRGMLRDGGCLLCKTWLWDETTNFRNWFYQNDPTHTFFYSAQTMAWIAQKFGFSRLEVNNRVISLWV